MDRPNGIHHISVMTRDAQLNHDFFSRVMGMRLVKKTVNQDDPGVYHLYYGDRRGSPGTVFTFFPWPNLAAARPGANEHVRTAFKVAPGQLEYWARRLDAHGTASSQVDWFDTPGLELVAPDGTAVLLVEAEDPVAGIEPWATADVSSSASVRGFHAIEARVRRAEPTRALLVEVLGFEVEESRGPSERLSTGQGSGQHFVLTEGRGHEPAKPGSGSIHHVAFRVPSDEAHRTVREHLLASGVTVTPIIDRYYFKAMYFRDSNGLLFEIATDPPGFAVDEPLEQLGRRLALPPFLEGRRSAIKQHLPALQH